MIKEFLHFALKVFAVILLLELGIYLFGMKVVVVGTLAYIIVELANKDIL